MKVSLTWDSDANAVARGRAFYKVYAGRSPGVTEVVLHLEEGQAPSGFLSAGAESSSIDFILPDGVMWYVSISAIGTNGSESARSSEVTQINKYTSFRA